MTLRSSLLFEISRRLLPKPVTRTVDYSAYQDWRTQSLSASWAAFEHVDLRGKRVLDFGCGDGALALFLARERAAASVVGIDLEAAAIERATAARDSTSIPPGVVVEFHVGSVNGIPVPDASIDVLVAFDCLEHVMSPSPIFQEWFRVLRPGGRCILEWFPYKGPWGPHMESLIPVPWAHILFGQRAMFRAAERIYDLPQFVPRHWDLDPGGKKKTNKWRNWSSFKEQGYINELDLKTFRQLVRSAGLKIARLDTHSFGGSYLRRTIGNSLMKLPIVGEYFVSFTTIELLRPDIPH
ncbi:MAG: methyltransferase domain-containing protein [Steroidobacteraceae bacterium]